MTMEEKYPNIKTYPDYDGVIDVAYIKLNDGKSHHCQESTVHEDVILDFDSGDRMIGIEVLCPANDVMRGEIVKQMLEHGVTQADVDLMMKEIPKE